MDDERAQAFLPYGRQNIDESDIEAVIAALKSPYVTQGPLVEDFEAGLCDYLGADYATVVCNGTAALHLAYAALDIGPGDEIITAPLTFAATANAARYLNAELRFADVDPDSGNILPSSVATLVGPKTKAIVAVHLGGLPCDMQELRNVADRHNLWLVEDAAHALGATYRGHRIGSGLADLATFSFHPVKHLTTGEGGAVLTNNNLLKERLDRLRHHGVERCSDKFSNKSPGRWYYEVQELGYNYRLTDFQCALGLSQLEKQPAALKRRREIASRYRARISAGLGDYVSAQRSYDDRQSAYHLFPVLIDFDALGISREEVMDSLERQGIGTQVHYIPVSWQPYYQERYGQPQAQVGVHHYYQRTLSLPMYPGLGDTEVDHVVDSLARALGQQLPAKVAS
ncbi:MAG: UDP-4-amino-4,6-dideoxy-N-acetyl-beta-L-altrosamine transaminase [Myxococcales bacterium]|nr:UDP-4-amino-4,6-dideoxy-N-acetyl-beta-L-altrosamine transaminase [Myxococcales bacterium]